MMLSVLGLLFSIIDQPPTMVSTVGLGAQCRYQPSELEQAMLENPLLYVTNEFVVTSLRIENEGIHLIGGYDSCADIQLGINSQKKTTISGANNSVAVSIDVQLDGHVVLENFSITEGWSEQAGGIEIINAQSFHLTNSWVHGNVSGGSGGGIHSHANGMELQISASKIYRNTAADTGGGMAISGHSNLIELRDSLLVSNHAGRAGGGVACQNRNLIHVVDNDISTYAWVADNQSPVAANVFTDLLCLLQLTSNDHMGFTGE